MYKKMMPLFNMLLATGFVFLALIVSRQLFNSIAFSQSAATIKFKRLDYRQPSDGKNSSYGNFYFEFEKEVTGRLVNKDGIPVFYVDFLGASIDKSPFVMNFPHGPAKIVRLTQVSDYPRVLRSTFFLRKNLLPQVRKTNKGFEVSFSEANSEGQQLKQKAYSLISPVQKPPIKKVVVEKPEPVHIKFADADLKRIYLELSKQIDKMVYFRDPLSQKGTINIQAASPMAALHKIAAQQGQVVSEEDGEIWITDPRNPILTIPENFMINGADLSGMALGDVLRALGQIAEINIILDPSLESIQERQVNMYLKKQTVRRGLETLLKIHGLCLENIDKQTMLVLTQKRARELEGKVVRVVQPKIPFATLKLLLEKALSPDISEQVSINDDIGNLVLVGHKEVVEQVQAMIDNIERKITSVGEGSVREFFQAINTEAEELIKLAKETLNENENLSINHDQRTDRVILSGSKESVKRAMQIMARLDQPVTRQALINIKLIEVNRKVLEEIGISLPRTLVSTSDIGHVTSSDYIIPAQLVAFIENTNAKTLANPTIRCMDKEESTIDISEQIPVKNTVTEYLPVASASLAARTSDNWTTSEVGIKMSVKPFIHQNNEISMEVDIDQTELISLVEGHPWTAKRQIKTRVRVADRETVVIGGLIRKKKSKTRKPVPLLSRIPLLRRLVRNVEHKNDNDEQTELVVLITPGVVGSKNTSASEADISAKKARKLAATSFEK